ncbi:uncharacterized protein EDB91DRAFT_1246852 [Suillus paluster]|uniref:uncharacterized protein n=1 Tax=Suillus paluster TaxID=48578 RepID=UPI001B87E065|nr:uncharacterized protein EDB91DRAFT_1246852 [Suillus paluster]KAG1743968.1 hypothetical protein EDB91DRAFT_1246852 [Suillus paluster]
MTRDNLQARLADFTTTHGNLPEPSIPQLLEAEQPFRTAWAETSDKLARADWELRRMQRAERASIEMLKVIDSLIQRFETQIHQGQSRIPEDVDSTQP